MELKPLSGITKTLQQVLMISISVSLILILVKYYAYYKYSASSLIIEFSRVVWLIDIIFYFQIFTEIILSIPLAVCFLMWVYRINKNLHELSPITMRFTPGCAVGWFFIPIANFIKAYQIMREIWQAVHTQVASSRYTIIKWWLIFFIFAYPLQRILYMLAGRIEGDEFIAAKALFGIASDVIDLIWSLVILDMITRIWTAYLRNHEDPVTIEVQESADL